MSILSQRRGTMAPHGPAAYSFPQNGVLDNFNRANEGPPPSANWVTVGAGDLQVASNQMKALGGASYGRWSATSFNADQEVFMTIPVKPLNTEELYLFVRMTTDASPHGYFLDVQTVAGTDVWEIYKATPGSTLISTSPTLELVAGDKIGMNVIGNVISGYVFQSGVWTQVVTCTDSTFTGGGYIGCMLQNATVRADDFGGGSIV